ncbi:hypothetical protein GL267_007245 [Acidithiobacillus ferrianus]|uniref:Uncharacterized protein n=1 Tax=Acidithiobacillus ferrianus TaxID=2678518 RepID=A0ACD5HA49_9PROT|nr:hypothetical protein [Acidithiobacillus ferrianus]
MKNLKIRIRRAMWRIHRSWLEAGVAPGRGYFHPKFGLIGWIDGSLDRDPLPEMDPEENENGR